MIINKIHNILFIRIRIYNFIMNKNIIINIIMPEEFILTKEANRIGFSKKRKFVIDNVCYVNKPCKKKLLWKNNKNKIYGILDLNSIKTIEKNNKNKITIKCHNEKCLVKRKNNQEEGKNRGKIVLKGNRQFY
jgi:hypothetical protein